ncbi:unnamed protein product [Rotaria sp. Silwood2]|nr:unnamed protein product [Rotaria sp. Silwood2]CAF2541958.1 unnamed protein product [Rotaria sp. Silwood2]CAF2778225.1 unnamed protein product [Rotaria sp. Silwood2]CAF2952830.1 unnamed protein product [Rotaria sp. Silwood2]CAF3966954.1 unnamed protein product [Rotaria sp. Silwood2]
MEKKQRTHINDSPLPTPQEAAASLDPLVQPINDQDGAPVYIRRQSSVFFVPISIVNENEEKITEEKKSNFITKCLSYMERFSGILYSLCASLLFTCSNFALKQFNIVILDVLVIRIFVQVLLSLGFIIYKGYNPFHDGSGLLVFIRSLFAAAGSISFYLGLSILPLPDLTTIRYTQVVWTALLALFIFHERITLPTIIACILTLIGVVCVAQPTFLFSQSKIQNETLENILTDNKNNNHLYGMLLAVSCAFSISMSIVLNKKLLQKNVRQSIIMFYFLLMTLILSVIIQIYYLNFSKTKHLKFNFETIFFKKDFIFATIIAILQLFPMILSQKSIKREHPSIVTVVQSSDILFAIILQNVFSSIKTNLLELIGSTLVLTSIFIVGGHKLWLDRQNRTYIPTSTEENVLKVETKINK